MKFVVPVVEGVDLEGLLNVYGKDAVGGVAFLADPLADDDDTSAYVMPPHHIHGEFKTVEKREILDVTCIYGLKAASVPGHAYVFDCTGKIIGHAELDLDSDDPAVTAVFGKDAQGFVFVHREGDSDAFEVSFLTTADGTANN